MQLNWDALDDGPRRVLRTFMDRNAPEPPRTAVWPAFGRRCLVDMVPKAATAREGIVDERRRPDLRMQEKLNGVWVLWDGQRLWTKTGNEIRAPPGFVALLPPSVAIVGELYLGGGHNPFWYANELSRNVLPSYHALPSGSYGASARIHIWQHARVVAFDAPGLGENVAYAQRYAALALLIGAWSARVRNTVPQSALLPLQLVRQYPVDRLPEMFREVVEGSAWSERRFPAFGVPAGAFDARGAYRPRADAPWILDAEHRLYGQSADTAVSGEGLMLWDQTGHWMPRGASGRPTPYIIKYKPRLVSTGWVVRPPYHTHHRREQGPDEGDDGAAGNFIGYRVDVRWWDPLTTTWTVVRPVVSPRLDARRVAALFPVDQRVFFTFVWYDRGPQFMSALGPSMSHWDAQRIQRGLQTNGRAGPLLLPSLDALRDAAGWEEGRTYAIFPTHFAWDHRRFCERTRGERLIAASVALAPPAGWEHRDADRLQAVVDRQWREVAQRRQRGLAAVERAFDRTLDDWLAAGAHFERRFALHACACVAAWSVRAGLMDAEWWSPAGADHAPAAGVALPRRWGPFAITPDARPEAQWLNGMAHVLLAAVAAVWLHMGDRFNGPSVPPTDTVRVDRTLRLLEEGLAPFWTLELEPRWRAVRHLFYPDGSDGVLFDRAAPGTLRPAHVARAVLDAMPPGVWRVAWGSRDAAHVEAVPDRIPIDVAGLHDAWMAEDHRLAPLYRTMRGNVRREQWRPAWQDARVRRDTHLPLLDNPRPLPEMEADLEPPDAYTTARRAMERALLNA